MKWGERVRREAKVAADSGTQIRRGASRSAAKVTELVQVLDDIRERARA